MIISIIAAVAENRVIGNKNKLPWHLPADLAYFEEKTRGKTLIVGFKTFQSIGKKPLPGRKHIILYEDSGYKVPRGCFIATSVDHALEMVKNNDEVMVCGGALVYKQFLPLAQRLYITYIHHTFEGDAYFPEFDMKDWKEVSREDHQPDQKNQYPYSFVILERI